MKNQLMYAVLVILIGSMTFCKNSGSGKQNKSKSEQVGSTILMIVGDENGTAIPGQGTGDLFIQDHLRNMGHKVILAVDSTESSELYKAAESADLVLVAESTTSLKLLNKVKNVATPVLSYEAFIQDDMGMTTIELPGDPGEPDDFNYGVRAKDTGIDIIMPNHPLAAALEGHITVYKEPRQVTWGKVGKGANVVATLTGIKDAATIYVYEKGSELFDGSIATGKRIGFFIEEENITGTSNFMTEDGLKLFDAAVKYALSSDEAN